ncbi:MAG: hypothetical protein FWD32_01610, partial [Firmicutes bacterium]|nr:hypothetical protein [Bacillota bacterium]
INSQIEKNEKLRGIISAADVENMVDSFNSNAGGKIVEKIKHYAKTVKEKAEKRRNNDSVAEELIKGFDETYANSIPKESAGKFDKFNQELDSNIMDEKIENAGNTSKASAFDKAFAEAETAGSKK